MIMVNGCFLCKRNVELYNHIILWCLFVYQLWILACTLLGIYWGNDWFGEGRDSGMESNK